MYTYGNIVILYSCNARGNMSEYKQSQVIQYHSSYSIVIMIQLKEETDHRILQTHRQWRNTRVHQHTPVGFEFIFLESYLLDWLIKVLRPTRHKIARSHWRRSSQTIFWLSTEKLNKTQQKQTWIHNKISYNIKWTPKN